jgi:hypothetical protein
MSSVTIPLNIIIVEKNAELKLLSIKDFKEEELFKKCGFKKQDDFLQQMQWNIKIDGIKYLVQVYAKTEGRANSENKYDFPPPIDSKLFFGNCAIIAKKQDPSEYVNLSLDLWKKMYEKLFGGFEDLTMTAIEDENETDELQNIPKSKKTKDGYLKDGFVVDSSDTDDECGGSDVDEDDCEVGVNPAEDLDGEDEINLEDIGSELSEDEYDYETCSEDGDDDEDGDEESEESEESEDNK